MRAEHHVQSHHMMFNMNLWSIGILAISKSHLCILIIQGIFMQGGQGWNSAESTRLPPMLSGVKVFGTHKLDDVLSVPSNLC